MRPRLVTAIGYGLIGLACAGGGILAALHHLWLVLVLMTLLTGAFSAMSAAIMRSFVRQTGQ